MKEQKRHVSLVARVGSYKGIDASLVKVLKKLPKNASFIEAVSAITKWGIEDVKERMQLQNEILKT